MRFLITSIETVAPGVKFFCLEPLDASFSFIPGQFVTLLHDDHGLIVRRSYSLFRYRGLPAIGLKRIDNGIMSRWLHDAAVPGDLLESDGGAQGLFHLERPATSKALWLFAAGIGITPVFAVLCDALETTSLDVALVYSSHSRADCVLREELEALGRQYPARLRIVWLFSDAKNLLRARLSRESFPAVQREVLTQAPGAVTCFICGPAKYMWLVRLLLESAGVPDSAIRQERFVPERNHITHNPPDKDPHRITLRTRSATHVFTAAFPDSILRAARKAGLDMPYSCDAGQCGSCMAYRTSGNVWMSYNEVLTPKDLEAGRVLTCTGYPVGGDVTIEIR